MSVLPPLSVPPNPNCFAINCSIIASHLCCHRLCRAVQVASTRCVLHWHCTCSFGSSPALALLVSCNHHQNHCITSVLPPLVSCCPGGFYSLCAALAMYMFFWQFPSPGTPLFLADEGPVAVLLKQARGGGMVLAGEPATQDL
jgi:hypothetical protein